VSDSGRVGVATGISGSIMTYSSAISSGAVGASSFNWAGIIYSKSG